MSDSDKERDALVEALASAYRARDPDGAVVAHRAFADLDEAGRLEAFDETRRARMLEAAMDPDGLSSTGRAVLARVLAAGRSEP